MNVNVNPNVIDVLRLFRLGLIPEWMWSQWKPHTSPNAADRAPSFRIRDINQRIFFFFAIALTIGEVVWGSSRGPLKIAHYSAIGLCLFGWFYFMIDLVHWAQAVKVFYKASGLTLVAFLGLDREGAKKLAYDSLVTQAWRVLGTQRDNPCDTTEREMFKRQYETFDTLTLVDPSQGWKVHFNAGEVMLKEKGWKGVYQMDFPVKMAQGGFGGD